MLFKDVPLRTRRGLSLYKVSGDNAFLALKGTSLNSVNALLAVSRRYHLTTKLWESVFKWMIGCISKNNYNKNNAKTWPQPPPPQKKIREKRIIITQQLFLSIIYLSKAGWSLCPPPPIFFSISAECMHLNVVILSFLPFNFLHGFVILAKSRKFSWPLAPSQGMGKSRDTLLYSHRAPAWAACVSWLRSGSSSSAPSSCAAPCS